MPANAVRRFHTEAPSMRVLRWIVLPLLGVHVVLATLSGYRAIWQIYRLDLRVERAVLRPGATVGFEVVSSGRVEADAVLELIQGPVAETLAVRMLPRTENASYDPRPKRPLALGCADAGHTRWFEAWSGDPPRDRKRRNAVAADAAAHSQRAPRRDRAAVKAKRPRRHKAGRRAFVKEL